MLTTLSSVFYEERVKKNVGGYPTQSSIARNLKRLPVI
jgi:hypothetical protein